MIQSWQKSYDDVNIKDLELKFDDRFYLKILHLKGVMRFRKKGKVSPWYMGPYNILKRVRKVDYEFDLPNELVRFIWYFR